MIERSRSGVWRLPLAFGWAIGLWPHCYDLWIGMKHYPTGGWSFALLWFHIGRKVDRENWLHWKDEDLSDPVNDARDFSNYPHGL
jgi:hypothetical protein